MTHPVEIADSPAAVAERASTLMATWIHADRASGPVHVALAGGTTPAATYRHLVRRMDDWSDVHLWFGDERHVPHDSVESNYRAAREDLIAPARIAPSNVHAVPTAGDVMEDAHRYGIELAAIPAGPDALPRFSLVLLGMGPDGHVASLFPHSRGLSCRDVCVGVTDSPKPPPHRISLSLATINAAGRRLLIVTGSSKATALAAAVRGPDPGTPASMLSRDATVIIADQDASSQLP